MTEKVSMSQGMTSGQDEERDQKKTRLHSLSPHPFSQQLSSLSLSLLFLSLFLSLSFPLSFQLAAVASL